MLLDHGVKPIWVFDGKPPEGKSGTLSKRRQVKEEAKSLEEEAKEQGNLEEELKQH